MRRELRNTRTVRKLTQKIVSNTTRNGKRYRRAVIRARHAMAAGHFIRWLDRARGLSGDFYKPHRMEARNWHEWYALGCP